MPCLLPLQSCQQQLPLPRQEKKCRKYFFDWSFTCLFARIETHLTENSYFVRSHHQQRGVWNEMDLIWRIYHGILLPVSEGFSQQRGVYYVKETEEAFNAGKHIGPLIPRTRRAEGEKNEITLVLFLNCGDNAAHVANPRSSGKNFPLF